MFSWKPIYAEISDKLLEFETDNAQLVQMLKRFFDRGLKVSSLIDKIDGQGTEAILSEIDPFTFIGNFNRGITDANRTAIIEAIKTEWQLSSPLPTDYSGLPLLDLRRGWLMPYAKDRLQFHVPRLWQFYRHFHGLTDVHQLDTELFDGCIKLKYVGLATLTMGMFWARPELWFALDSRNREMASSLGVTLNPGNGKEYIAWLDSIRSKTEKSPAQLSHEAFLGKPGPTPNADFASPFNRLFTDETHANLVLDCFERVLKTLKATEDDDLLACSTTLTGATGARMTVIYGRWMVFRYIRKSGKGSYEILLPADSPLVASLETTFHYKKSVDDSKYVLARIGEAEFHDNIETYIPTMQAACRTAKTASAGLTVTPYAKFHAYGLIALALDPSVRATVLRDGLETTEYDFDYWLLAPGQNASLWDSWREQKVGTMGWSDTGNLLRFKSKDLLQEHIEEKELADGPGSAANMLWNFSREMKQGDIVFAKNGLFKVCGWGVVSGDYYFDKSADGHQHFLPINWKCSDELTMPTGVQLAMQTLTRMTAKTDFLQDMGARYMGIPGLEGGTADPIIDPIGPIVQKVYTKSHAMKDLFLAESKVDKIVDLLRRKKNIVLQGAPGTGKTFVARRLAYLLLGVQDESRVPMVQFHQSTTYEDFIQGYRPNSDSGFSLRNGNFFKFVQRAHAEPDQDFVFIIDEINRGNLSKVFGELMMLIESDKRSKEFAVPLTYSVDGNDTFYVPPNVHFIGTMNTADRSLSMVDYALRRRFAFIELDPEFDSPQFKQHLQAQGASEEMVQSIRDRMNNLNQLVAEDATNLGRGYRIGHSFFVPTNSQRVTQEWIDSVVEFEIIPLLEEYWCDDPLQLSKARTIALGRA